MVLNSRVVYWIRPAIYLGNSPEFRTRNIRGRGVVFCADEERLDDISQGSYVKSVFTWSGRHFGFLEGEDLWSHHGKHVGRKHGTDIFAPTGRYLGELMTNG